MPADRLPPVAARILAGQPDPPRLVSWRDVWEVNWPFLAYIQVPTVMFAAVIALLHSKGLWSVIGLLIVLDLMTMAVWFGSQTRPQIAALRNGVSDTGTVADLTVLPRGGYRGRLELEHGTGTEPVDFAAATSHKLKVGDRMNVLVNPANGRVLTAIGINDQPI